MAGFVVSSPVLEASQVQLDAASGQLTTVYVSPNKLAQSPVYGRKYYQLVVVPFDTDVSVGDGKHYFYLPDSLVGSKLAEVSAAVATAGVTGTMTVQVNNTNEGVNMLSTALTIDTGELTTGTAATPPVIDTVFDHRTVAAGWIIRIDIDAIHTTAAKGLIVNLGFSITEGE